VKSAPQNDRRRTLSNQPIAALESPFEFGFGRWHLSAAFFARPRRLQPARLVRAQLYGIAPSDPRTLLIAAAISLATALAASWLPALRIEGGAGRSTARGLTSGITTIICVAHA